MEISGVGVKSWLEGVTEVKYFRLNSGSAV